MPVCWILENTYDYSDPALLIDRGLELHRKYYFKGLMVEANGPQEIYAYLGIRAMKCDIFLLKHPVNFVPVKKVYGNKFDRIYEILQPKCRLGQLLIRPSHNELERELKLFIRNPKGIHLLDAIAMGLRYSDVCVERVRVSVRRSLPAKKQTDIMAAISSPLEVFKQIGMLGNG